MFRNIAELTAARRRGAGFTMIEIMIVLAVISIIALIAIPNLLAGKTAANESATIANQKALCTAQFQYMKKIGNYSANCAHLGALHLVPPDLANAFESYHDNGDTRTSPKAGYYYRVLHGDGASDTSYWPTGQSGADAEMTSFGFTCRSAEPYSTGEFQYFVGEQGVIYKKAEAHQGDAQYRLFFCNALPATPPSTWSPAK